MAEPIGMAALSIPYPEDPTCKISSANTGKSATAPPKSTANRSKEMAQRRVNQMFISSSNEIGAFESGMAAQYMGTIRSVIFGGCMTIFFVILAFAKGKELKNFEFEKN